MTAPAPPLPWHIGKLRRIRRSAWLAILLCAPFQVAPLAVGPATASAISLPIHSENNQ